MEKEGGEMRGKTMLVDLTVALTPEEVHERSRQLSQSVETLGELEVQVEEVKTTAKEQVKFLTHELMKVRLMVDRLASAVRDEQEVRPVPCTEQLDGTRVLVVRNDTREIVTVRQATEAERQMGLDLEVGKVIGDDSGQDLGKPEVEVPNAHGSGEGA